MIFIRRSFGAKLLSALLGTVGLLLIVMFLVVRFETAQQVELVVGRTVQNAGTLFQELTNLRRQQAERVARPFTDGRRALALLDAAIDAGDVDWLADQVDYEMQLAELTDVLVVFTDGDGVPVLSLVGGQRVIEGDPANVVPIASDLLRGDQMETRGYRVVDGRMYDIRSLYIELASRPIGTITFGFPILAEDVGRIGSVGGFEACFHIAGRCVVATPGVDADLAALMLNAVDTNQPLRMRAGGREWSVQMESLSEGQTEPGRRIVAVAVPLDDVLAPFARIQSALLLGGAGALLVSMLLGAALSRSLTRPVHELVSATARVAEGDYDAEVNVQSRDEIGTLADAFNDMTRGLLLRERYRSVLNKVVSQDVAEELMRGDVELGGENRDVSVLFADIRGFTPLTEGMEPQEVIVLLNECMEHLSKAVDAEGGVVDKFIGDELMAVFGAPVTQADHAQRAVAAALRMQKGIAERSMARAAPAEGELKVGVGINSGVAVAGNMGSTDRMNYTVLGATVNLASRLASEAEAGEILIGEETRRAVGQSVLAQPCGRRTLKGFSTPVEVFAVCGNDTSEDV